jgi:hypothetical protein
MCKGKEDAGGPCRCSSDAYRRAEARSVELEVARQELAAAEEAVRQAERDRLVATPWDSEFTADDLYAEEHAQDLLGHRERTLAEARELAQVEASELVVDNEGRDAGSSEYRAALDALEAAYERDDWDQGIDPTLVKNVLDLAPDDAARSKQRTRDAVAATRLEKKRQRALRLDAEAKESGRRLAEHPEDPEAQRNHDRLTAGRYIARQEFEAAAEEMPESVVLKSVMQRPSVYGVPRLRENPALADVTAAREDLDRLAGRPTAASTEQLVNAGGKMWNALGKAGEIPGAGRNERVPWDFEEKIGRGLRKQELAAERRRTLRQSEDRVRAAQDVVSRRYAADAGAEQITSAHRELSAAQAEFQDAARQFMAAEKRRINHNVRTAQAMQLPDDQVKRSRDREYEHAEQITTLP